MKDILIHNGYFHLWQSYVQFKQIDIVIMSALELEQAELKQILNAPIAMQSSHAFFLKLLKKTQQFHQNNSFIFEMATYVKPEHFGVLGYMATRSETVAEALSYILRFSRLVIDGDEITPMQMHQQGEFLRLSWPFINAEYNLINELTNAMMVVLARQILPFNDMPLRRIEMANEALMPIYQYQKFYGCEVVFQQAEYGFILSMQGLSLKPQQADSSLMQLLVNQAEDAIASKPKYESLDRQLNLMIADYLKNHQQAPKLKTIASELHMSVRTLQRQLKELNTSFKEILEQARMTKCLQLLGQKNELNEIASVLGYSDQSALARAFKAYYGSTLLAKRRELIRIQMSKSSS